MPINDLSPSSKRQLRAVVLLGLIRSAVMTFAVALLCLICGAAMAFAGLGVLDTWRCYGGAWCGYFGSFLHLTKV